MAGMNMNDWSSRLLKQQQRVAMPICTHLGIEMIGKTILDAVTDGKVQFQAIQTLAQNTPSAAAVTIMDLTVEAEAFGSRVIFSANELPVLNGRIVSDFESVRNLVIPGLNKGRLPEYIRASHMAAEGIHDKPVFGGCIGPFSLAGRLFDMTEIMTSAWIEPETIHALLEKCTRFLHHYVEELKKTGINGMIIAEPASGLLDESLCDQFSSVYVRKLVEAFQDDHFFMFLHNCGNTGHVTRSMLSTGARGLHFGNHMDMQQVLKEVPENIVVSGNLDPVGVFKMATPEKIKDITLELLEMAKEHPNFVISSGCDIPPGVPAENIRAFYEGLAEFNN